MKPRPTILPYALICLLGLSNLPLESFGKADTEPTPARAIISTPIEGKDLEEMLGPIVMGNMPILQVLDLLRNFSGRVIIPGEGIPLSKLNFNSGGKLKRAEAIAALEDILALNGVTLKLMDNGFVRAISSADPNSSSAPLIDSIPEGLSSEQIYTKVFRLDYMDSQTAFTRVRSMISGKKRAAVVNQPEINSIILTDSLNNIKRIGEVLELLDQAPEVRLELYAFPIVHSSPFHIRGLYNQIYRSSLNQRLRSSLVYADSRSNKLIVVTHPSNYDFFENLVKELDQEVAPFTTTEVIKITQGNFWSIWSTLRGIVSHQQRQFSRRGILSSEERETSNIQRLSAAGESTAINDESAVDAVETATLDADPSLIMTEDANPELQFSPYIGLYADASNMAYIVYGTQNDIARIRSLVAKLDIKSAPYVDSQVIDVLYARASDIRNVIEYTINIQRRNFSRAGIQSGSNQGQSETAPTEMGGQGFEYR